MTGHQQTMVNHLRDMFSGTFDEDLIESVLMQRNWNVDRALDDLMALTSGCTFNVPIEDFDTNNDEYLLQEFTPTVADYSNSVLSYPSSMVNNGCNSKEENAVFLEDEGSAATDERAQESEDDIIVLNEEEYCIPIESESELDDECNKSVLKSIAFQSSEKHTRAVESKLSYAMAATTQSTSLIEQHATARTRPPNIVYSGYTSYDRIKRTRDSLERVKLYVRDGFKIMVLLRGLPGSGKSYLARHLIKQCGLSECHFNYHVHSADNFFYLNKKGVYRYEPDKLSEAHRWNVVNVLHVLREALTPIVIDNTNTQMWEMKSYAAMAVCAGYEIEVVEPDTVWALNVSQLSKKNQHSVTKDKIAVMLSRYEYNVTALSLLKQFGLEYSHENIPPQMGVRELTNKRLTDVLDNISNNVQAANVVSTKRLFSKAEKKIRKNGKKKRKKMEKLIEEGFPKAPTIEMSPFNDKEKNELDLNNKSLMSGNSESDDDGSSRGNGWNNVDSYTSKKENNEETEDDNDDENGVEKEEDDEHNSSWASVGTWSTIDNLDDDFNDIDDKLDENNEGILFGNMSDKNSNSFEKISEHENDNKMASVLNNSAEHAAVANLMDLSDNEMKRTDRKEKTYVDDENWKNDINETQQRKDEEEECTVNVASDLKRYQFSNQLYEVLAKNVPRLKCFESFHHENNDEDEGNVKGCLSEKENNTSIENILSKETASAEENTNFSGTLLMKEPDEKVAFQNMWEATSKCLNKDVSNVFGNNSHNAEHNSDYVPALLAPSCQTWFEDMSNARDNLTSPTTFGTFAARTAEYNRNVIVTDEDSPVDRTLSNCSTKNLVVEEQNDILSKEKHEEFFELENQNDCDSRTCKINRCNETFKFTAESAVNLLGGGGSDLNNDLNETATLDEYSKFGIYDPAVAKKNVSQPDSFKFNSQANLFGYVSNRRTKICNVENSLKRNVLERNKFWREAYDDVDDHNNRANQNKDDDDNDDCNSSFVNKWPRDAQHTEQDSRLDQSAITAVSYRNDMFAENSDQGSNSSLLEGARFEDIHNSVNRFVNNDIKRKRGGVERKLENVNRAKDMKNKNVAGALAVAASGRDDNTLSENACWNAPSAPELNTLKERILINSLDKVFNQSGTSIEAAAESKAFLVDGIIGDTTTIPCTTAITAAISTRESKQSNLSTQQQRKMKAPCSSSFQVIENRLHDGWEDRCSNINYKPENNGDENVSDKNDVAFWNSWIRSGETWDASSKTTAVVSTTKIEHLESKPQRKVAKESPIKQKNSVRLINDIKSYSCENCVNNEAVASTNSLKSSNIWSSNDSILHLSNKWDIDDQNEHCTKTASVMSSKDLIAVDSSSPPLSGKLLSLPEERPIGDGKAKKSTSYFLKETDFYFVDGERSTKFTASKNDSQTWNWALEAKSSSVVSTLPLLPHSTSSSEINDPNVAICHKINEEGHNIQIEATARETKSELRIAVDNAITAPLQTDKNERDDLLYEGDAKIMRQCKQKCKSLSSSPLLLLPPPVLLEPAISDIEGGNFFIPVEILNLGQNKATNTGAEDTAYAGHQITARCREINKIIVPTPSLDDDRIKHNDSDTNAVASCTVPIGTSCRSDKSTMTESNQYTVKVKPLREDLSNIFPENAAETILDLYEKCNGNMDWIIEILLEDGYSPSELQLEYLSSLQNVVDYDLSSSSKNGATVKDKLPSEKKKKASRKNGRKNENRESSMTLKKWEIIEADTCEDDSRFIRILPTELETITEREKTETAEILGETVSEDMFDETAESVDLFLDWTSVSQLIKYFGNPTVYPIKDYQPVVRLPVTLARQIHAHLIEGVIDQAEKNECLINRLNEEEHESMRAVDGLTSVDVTDVENSLSEILVNSVSTISGFRKTNELVQLPPKFKVVRDENSFASKLSLNLLLKAFPTLNPTFVVETFRSRNYNYYDTKEVLNQYKKEVTTVPDTSFAATADYCDIDYNCSLDETNDESNVVRLSNLRNVLFDNTEMNGSRADTIERVKQYRSDAAFNYEQWEKCSAKLKAALREKKFGVAAYYREIMNAFKQKYEKCNATAAAVLVTSCCFQNERIIDLHFFKVTEALQALDMFLDHHICKITSHGRQKCLLYIITGRGSRSIDGVSHLQPPIINRLKRRRIEFMMESTNAGLVKAVIRKTSSLSRDL